jgi:hypothetical protein
MLEEIPSASARKSRFVKVLAVSGFIALVLLGLWWWQNRPIQPVVLTQVEKEAVEKKVEMIQKPADPRYEKGSREIVLSERELNGLLNERTALGRSLRFELATNAIHARVETDLDPDLPLLGGRHLKARARFLTGEGAGVSGFTLDDVTVWGISLPNEWLGGLKGRDLLGELLGGKGGRIPGVEEFKVETGRLTVRLAE